MKELEDGELLAQLARRIEDKNDALQALQVTTRKLGELNQRLLESEQLKGRFLSNIRNEINNPLAAIQAIARELGAGAAADPAEAAALAATILRESLSLDFQLHNIFVAAELEAGETALVVAHLDARRLVEETVASFQPLAGARRVALAFSWDEAGCSPFRSDAAKLQIIVANLVSNAVKFSHEGGEVTVSGSCVGGELAVSVRDRGIGIAASEQHRIFERFLQLEEARAAGCGGNGLGLSVVRALVELLGGGVAIESAPGEGSTFTVRIPEAAQEAAAWADGGTLYFGEERF
ncbi:MAG TPA: HAMP domain-containing sensor histidine kinase [bacterium]